VARAKRHYVAGHGWHITHRCHQRGGPGSLQVREVPGGYELRERVGALMKGSNLRLTLVCIAFRQKRYS
jgi:hypothetical protein